MRIQNTWIDGGSFLLALFVLAGTVAPLIENVRQNKAASNDYVVAAVGFLIAIVFFWLSAVIGKNQKAIRDVRRWLPEDGSTENREQSK
jgi:hypothetical protein